MEPVLQDVENAKFVFSIYDFDGTGLIDASYLGPALMALNLTPSLTAVSELGGTTRKGKKQFCEAEFLSIYANAKIVTDSGTSEDFFECLRSMDKHNSGKISCDQFHNLLQSCGEKLDRHELEQILQDCGDLKDGLIDYAVFVKNLMGGPENIKSEVRVDSKVEDLEKVNFVNTVAMNCIMPICTNEPKKKTVKPSVTIIVTDETDTIGALEPQTPTIADVAFSLKKTKSRPSSVSDQDKQAALAAAEAALKPKKQMPLISMKTKGLIGNIVRKKEVKS